APSGWPGNGFLANTIGRRCRILSSSMAVMPFTAVTRSLTPALPPRTAAIDCPPQTPPPYFRPAKTTFTRPASTLPGKRRRPQVEDGNGNIDAIGCAGRISEKSSSTWQNDPYFGELTRLCLDLYGTTVLLHDDVMTD